MERLVGSPCSLPKFGLDEVLTAYAALGLRKFEVFTGWVASRFDPAVGAQPYLAKAAAHGIRYTSLHLPPVDRGDPESLARAVGAARFAADLGVEVVLYKANSRESYVACAPAFLDALDEISVTPVIQNHFGTPLSSFADVREVMDGVGDPRLKLLLEVGHFAVAGVHWATPCAAYGDRIALVHVKDIANGKPVPFGTGDVDFAGLFARLDDLGYRGDFVVEIEVDVDEQERLRLTAAACDYLYTHGLEDL